MVRFSDCQRPRARTPNPRLSSDTGLPVMPLPVRIAGCLCAVLAMASPVRAQTADNLLLVINASAPDSVQVGEYYARKRAVSPERVLRLPMDRTEEITRAVYERQIEGPISDWLAERALHDRILYIVLAKGVPLRIGGTPGRNGTVASVD